MGSLSIDLGFGLSTGRAANGAVVIAVGGELDLYTAPDLERALARAVTENPRQVVVDLSATTFVDSTALHVLLAAARQMNGAGEVIVVAPDPNVRRVFEITGCDRIFSIVSSSPDANVLS